ncbi:hypothetical protein BTA51_06785 [Hahella sp. CCB-MM4]|uniref:DUF1127 domain-containing protein n=1 Tax=Hahella sp. (strain CCB-MM4) TaxID=1926491 RepID=UPI000BDB4311|nr:DUF1127 domain-containing protein [Hahella sp. CCB-MM4]OZG74682.1 hypothetical protein BTA51_06785 [Hahella sp. CCB-MM4]
MSARVDGISHSSHFVNTTLTSRTQGLLGQFIGHPVMAMLSQWKHNYQTRRQLAELPDSILDDIGLSTHQVQRELNKKFWQD